MVDGEELRAALDTGKERRLRAGHEGLASEVLEDGEQRGAAAGVEMRGDLVEQQDRHAARHLAGEAGVRQHDADQQRLLAIRN